LRLSSNILAQRAAGTGDVQSVLEKLQINWRVELGRIAALHCRSGYTSGMKTAVSIPDDLFRRADELADRLGKSRSQLYREALADYVARRDPAAVTAALNELADELAADRSGLVKQAARRALSSTEW
jgi:predicted transcriptional regulator